MEISKIIDKQKSGNEMDPFLFHWEQGSTRWTKEKGLFRNMMMRQYNPGITNNFNTTTRSRLVEGLRLTKRLHEHEGCVNTIRWDRCGRNLVSASDDLR